jgi:cell growth-regulating nucleolar protein
MVWFQCEDCGENLKKPKLAGHFRSCSAYKVTRRLSLSGLYFTPRGFSLLIGILTCDCATVWFGFVQLSCIDCGAVFSQDTVQTHTQCISEAVSSIASLPDMKFTLLL